MEICFGDLGITPENFRAVLVEKKKPLAVSRWCTQEADFTNDYMRVVVSNSILLTGGIMPLN